MLPRPLGTLPPSGSMHRWFPAVVTGSPISVSKRPSSCKNLVGAVGFEPTNPSLVRRNTVPITPGSARWFMHLNCENHALRCPGVPGVVCTVVPASGSRSSLLTPRSTSEWGVTGTARKDITDQLHLGDGPSGCPGGATAPADCAISRWVLGHGVAVEICSFCASGLVLNPVPSALVECWSGSCHGHGPAERRWLDPAHQLLRGASGWGVVR